MIENLIHNAYLDQLGEDWLAVNANGHPIARATTEAAVRQAAPDAAHYVNASMLQARVDDLDSGPLPGFDPAPVRNEGAKLDPTDFRVGLDAVMTQQAPADDVKPDADPDADDKAPAKVAAEKDPAKK